MNRGENNNNNQSHISNNDSKYNHLVPQAQNERLIIPLSRRADPAFANASVVFYRVVERVTSNRAAVPRVLLVSPRGVIYICEMNGRVTQTLHCRDVKWMRVADIKRASSTVVWCSGTDNSQTMISFRADHISNVAVCCLTYFIGVVQSFAPDLKINSEEALSAPLDLEPPKNIWTRMLEGVRTMRKLTEDDIANIAHPSDRGAGALLTETVDDTVQGVRNSDGEGSSDESDSDDDEAHEQLRAGGAKRAKNNPPVLILSNDSMTSQDESEILSNTNNDSRKMSRENSSAKIGVVVGAAATSEKKLQQQQQDEKFLSVIAEQQQNNRARTPVKRNATEQHLDDLMNKSTISIDTNNNQNADMTSRDLRLGAASSSPATPQQPSSSTYGQQPQLFATLRVTKVSDHNNNNDNSSLSSSSSIFRHHVGSDDGSALQFDPRTGKFQLSSFAIDAHHGGGGDPSLQQDITLFDIREAAFPNARDFSLVVAIPSNQQQQSSSTGRRQQQQQQHQSTVVVSASWDEPVIPITSSSPKKNRNKNNSSSNKAATFEYLQKLTNRFIRKLREYYPGIVIKTGSAANQDLMQLAAHVQTLTQQLGELRNKTHKMVNDIGNNNDDEEDLLDIDPADLEDDDDDDDILTGQGKHFRAAQKQALFGLLTWILQKPGIEADV